MDMIVNRATLGAPATRSERLPAITDCAMTAAFILFGIDPRAAALGGQWLCDWGLRAISPLKG
jgi:hypothetical protein